MQVKHQNTPSSGAFFCWVKVTSVEYSRILLNIVEFRRTAF